MGRLAILDAVLVDVGEAAVLFADMPETIQVETTKDPVDTVKAHELLAARAKVTAEFPLDLGEFRTVALNHG